MNRKAEKATCSSITKIATLVSLVTTANYGYEVYQHLHSTIAKSVISDGIVQQYFFLLCSDSMYLYAMHMQKPST